jgi:CheY-like chemotaxis protein
MATQQLASVLLVEDDPHTCNIFKMVLDHHELALTIVNDAETAFQHLQDHSPDVIVLDIFLPGTDGYQIFNRIRQQSLAPNAAIIATTAYYTEDTHSDVLARGFQGYLPKPINSASLVTSLENAIQNK